MRFLARDTPRIYWQGDICGKRMKNQALRKSSAFSIGSSLSLPPIINSHMDKIKCEARGRGCCFIDAGQHIPLKKIAKLRGRGYLLCGAKLFPRPPASREVSQGKA